MNDVLSLTSTKSLNYLFSGSSDKTIKMWNLSKKFSSACHRTFTGFNLLSKVIFIKIKLTKSLIKKRTYLKKISQVTLILFGQSIYAPMN